MRVLAVQNEAKVAALAATGLQKNGFTVETCKEGLSALHRRSALRRVVLPQPMAAGPVNPVTAD